MMERIYFICLFSPFFSKLGKENVWREYIFRKNEV